MVERIQSYEIIEKIGIGGMGIVYKARHIFQKKEVAIKVLSPQFCADQLFRRRFSNEAAILNKLDHPNIVKVFDFIEDNESLYLVMELAEGRTLDKMIGREVGPVPYEKAQPIFKQLLQGIDYAHSNGVLTHDIKPSNIIISQDNRVKITDFGIAKLEEGQAYTQTGTKMGTLHYMPPEAIEGIRTDRRGDVYSLGLTLYEMLSGHLPYKDDTGEMSQYAIMRQIIENEMADPREYYPNIPEWLVEIIKKASSKKKEDRYGSIKEFISAIDNKNWISEIIQPDPVENNQEGILTNSNYVIVSKPKSEINKNPFIYSTNVIILIVLAVYSIISFQRESNIPVSNLNAENINSNLSYEKDNAVILKQIPKPKESKNVISKKKEFIKEEIVQQDESVYADSFVGEWVAVAVKLLKLKKFNVEVIETFNPEKAG